MFLGSTKLAQAIWYQRLTVDNHDTATHLVVSGLAPGLEGSAGSPKRDRMVKRQAVSVEEINQVVAKMLAGQALRLRRATELLVHSDTLAIADAGDPETLINLAETSIRVASALLTQSQDLAGPLPFVPAGY